MAVSNTDPDSYDVSLLTNHNNALRSSHFSASNAIPFNDPFLSKMFDLQCHLEREAELLRQAIATDTAEKNALCNSAANRLGVAKQAITSDLPDYIVLHHYQLIADLLGPICRKLGFEILSDQCPRLSSGNLNGYFAWKQFLSSKLKAIITLRNDQQVTSQRFFIDNCRYLTSAFDRYFDLLNPKPGSGYNSRDAIDAIAGKKRDYLAVLKPLLEGTCHAWSDNCIVQLNQLKDLGFNKDQIEHHQVAIQQLYAARKAGNNRQQMFKAIQQAVKSRRTNFVVYQTKPRFLEAFDLSKFNYGRFIDDFNDVTAAPIRAPVPTFVARFLSGETLFDSDYQQIKTLLPTLTNVEFEDLKYFMQKDENKLLTVGGTLVRSNSSRRAYFDQSRIPDPFQAHLMCQVEAIDNLENAVALPEDTQAMSLDNMVRRAKDIRERLQQCRKVFSGEASAESPTELDLKNIEDIPTVIASFNRGIEQKEKQLEQNQRLLKVFKLITLRYCQFYRLRTKAASKKYWGIGWGRHGSFGQRRAEKLFKAIQAAGSMQEANGIIGQLMKQAAKSSVFNRLSGLRKGSLNETMVRAITQFNQVFTEDGSTFVQELNKESVEAKLKKFMVETKLLGHPSNEETPRARDDKLKNLLNHDGIDGYSFGSCVIAATVQVDKDKLKSTAKKWSIFADPMDRRCGSVNSHSRRSRLASAPQIRVR